MTNTKKEIRKEEMAHRPPQMLVRHKLGAGRIGTYSALGGIAGTVPLPWFPDAVARRIRGALAHDIAARHGLSLSQEARSVLAEPSGVEGPRGLVGHAAQFVATQVLSRIGPLGLLNPVRSAAQTFVLGHLWHRYLDGARIERSVRIDVEEARRVRRAIDDAVFATITSDVHTPAEDGTRAPEDLRDQLTVLTDGLVIGAASIPGWIVRRLEAAFDEVLLRIEG
jgi:hypothetical protein